MENHQQPGDQIMKVSVEEVSTAGFCSECPDSLLPGDLYLLVHHSESPSQHLCPGCARASEDPIIKLLINSFPPMDHQGLIHQINELHSRMDRDGE